ncbi:hypothetical protein VNI00_009208 [Paramarasmius palmivorus]|uniref:F-box domain-containing protein n=1 Tax=Paramarasmius palmivorus TaxID=297713 RepID=A0AAW0CRY9_9AGAR
MFNALAHVLLIRKPFRPSIQDLDDTTAKSISPDVIALLRSGTMLEPEEQQYTDSVLKQLDEKLASHTRLIDDLQSTLLILQHKKSILKWKHYRFRALKAPIRRVPPEILSYILLITIRESVKTFQPHGSAYSAATLFSQVSSRWRHIVRSTPQLWSIMSIVVHSDYRPSDVFIHHLVRAKEAPLDVELYLEGREITHADSEISSLLIQRRELWKRLRLHGALHNVSSFLNQFWDTLPLRELGVDITSQEGNWEDIIRIIHAQFPEIHFLRLAGPRLAVPDHHCKSFRRLTSIDLDLPVDTMFTIINLNSATLINIKFTVRPLIGTDQFAVDLELQSRAIKAVCTQEQISFPSLENLTFVVISNRYAYQNIAALVQSMLETPSLHSLAIQHQDPWGHAKTECDSSSKLFISIYELLSKCGRLPGFHTLELEEPPFLDEDLIHLLRRVPGLKRLRVTDAYGALTRKFLTKMTLTSEGM